MKSNPQYCNDEELRTLSTYNTEVLHHMITTYNHLRLHDRNGGIILPNLLKYGFEALDKCTFNKNSHIVYLPPNIKI